MTTISFLHGKINANHIERRHMYKELMPIAWHPLRWWDWCMSKDKKKEIEKLWSSDSDTVKSV